jgi:hypothetical protein
LTIGCGIPPGIAFDETDDAITCRFVCIDDPVKMKKPVLTLRTGFNQHVKRSAMNYHALPESLVSELEKQQHLRCIFENAGTVNFMNSSISVSLTIVKEISRVFQKESVV